MSNMKRNIHGRPKLGIPTKGKNGYVDARGEVDNKAARSAPKLSPVHLQPHGVVLQDMARARAADHGNRGPSQGHEGV